MDDLDVAMSLLTIWLHGAPSLDRGSKSVDWLEFSLKPASLNLPGEPPLLLKRKDWREQGPAFRTLDIDKRGGSGSIRRRGLNDEATPKVHAKRDAFFDLAEAGGIVLP